MWRALAGAGVVLLLGGQATVDGIGRSTGLPVPRFVALARDEVNLRYGPSRDHPVKWTYTREGLPVLIIDEFDTWRQIRDFEGGEGWIHQSLLTGQRNALITGEIRGLRRVPEADARVVLRAEPGVIGEILQCDIEWCRLEIAGRRGWLEKAGFYGALAGEVFD